jgi:deferrochelatase/peroxidase EfeB
MRVQLDLADIQGNILAAYGKRGFPKGRLMALHVDRPEAGRNLIETLRRRVTTALPWDEGRRKPQPGHVVTPRPHCTLNLAFTFHGLVALGVPVRTLRGMPDEFMDGMAARAGILCDNHPRAPGDDTPVPIEERWDPVWLGTGRDRVHILVTMMSEMDPETGQPTPALEAMSQEIIGMCAAGGGGVRVLEGHRGPDRRWQELSAITRRGKDGNWRPLPLEHFGLADGISETVFEGQMAEEDMARYVRGGGKLLADQSWAPLAAGEFLLGWPDESQEVPGAAMPLDFSRNGTFMALRKLHQNVAAWRRFTAEQSARLARVWNMPPEEAAPTFVAKMVGRWPDGVPLLRAPTYRDWQDYAGRRARATEAERLEIERELRDFTFRMDPDGTKCPFGAHIRRANTRDMLDPLFASADPKAWNGSILNNRRRLLRRGLPYGETPEAGDDSGEHGIVLMAKCASLFRQFEFVQQQWLQYGLDFNAGNDVCPITGTHFSGSKFVVAADPAAGSPPFIAAGIPQFVEARGGDYFFIPSMTALRMIAQGLVDPT